MLDTQQKAPVVHINFDAPVSDYRNMGEDLLFVFKSGLSKKAITQTFKYGQYEGSATDQVITTFNKLDSLGRMVVLIQSLSSGGRETDLWKWNGQQFAPAQSSLHEWKDDI